MMKEIFLSHFASIVVLTAISLSVAVISILLFLTLKRQFERMVLIFLDEITESAIPKALSSISFADTTDILLFLLRNWSHLL